MDQVKLYTVKEAAKIVGVSTNTLYKYLDEGRIKAARGSSIQGRFRIPATAIEEFLGVSLTTQVVDTPPIPVSVPKAPILRETVSLSSTPPSFSLRLTRVLVILALLAMCIDLFTTPVVSVITHSSRILVGITLLLLAFSPGGYRRRTIS